MKRQIALFLTASIIFTLLFSSCKNDNAKNQIVGTWRLAGVHSKGYEQQQQMVQDQMKKLQDSISAGKDSAKVEMFKRQLTSMQKNIDDRKRSEDSLRWIFLENGEFQDKEMGRSSKGIWSFDGERQIVYTIVEQQPAYFYIHWAKDTMLMQRDSANYLMFLKSTN